MGSETKFTLRNMPNAIYSVKVKLYFQVIAPYMWYP